MNWAVGPWGNWVAMFSWDDAPGWYGNAPLVLQENPRAEANSPSKLVGHCLRLDTTLQMQRQRRLTARRIF